VRGARREQLARLLAPRLLPGEEILGTGAAWFAEPRRRRLLLVGRHYRFVALTDQRVLVFPRRSRGRHGAGPLLDAPLDGSRLVRAGGSRLLYPVSVDVGDGRVVVLEFRPAERVLGRNIATALRHHVSTS
jgi:hypothetical protein